MDSPLVASERNIRTRNRKDEELGRAPIGSEVRTRGGWTRFDGMSQEDRDLLLGKGRKSNHQRGALIPTPAEESVYAVMSGQVRLYLPGPNGRELEEERRHAGEVFLLGTTSADEEVHILAKAMMRNTRLITMPFSQFVSSVRISASTVAWLMRMQGERYTETQRCLRERTFFPLKERLAHKLAETALETGRSRAVEDTEATVQETREGLAVMLGTRSEEVSRVLNYLKEENLVHFEMFGRQIELLDVQALKNYGRESSRGTQKRNRTKLEAPSDERKVS